MKKINWLSIVGGVATVAGFIIELVQSYVSEKEAERMIDEKINKAFEERGIN